MKFTKVFLLVILALALVSDAFGRHRRWGKRRVKRPLRPKIRKYCYKICKNHNNLKDKHICKTEKLRGACTFCQRVVKCKKNVMFFQHYFPSHALAKVNKMYAKRSQRSKKRVRKHRKRKKH